jgi:hypothetical protein
MVMATPADVRFIQGARDCLCWASGFAVDADGSPRAYAPAHSGLVGLDALGNAGGPGNWYGVVTRDGEPVVQGPGDPCPGYLVSATALVDPSKSDTDPRRYVDSETVPYISIPPELLHRGCRMGDLATVVYKERAVGAVLADVGPRGKLGEGSIALATALGIPNSPRNGGVNGDGVYWVLFPGTGAGWPIMLVDINSQATMLFEQFGGVEALEGIFENS